MRDAVGEDGQLTAAGPGNDDTDEFLDWLQTYQRVAITLDDEGAKEPGKVILSGDLPNAAPGLARQQLAGVHDPGRVAADLHRAQQLDAQLADLVGQVRRRGRAPPRGGG